MRVVILGGDGFCGWPTSLHFSARGHEVAIVDNFARRFADIELGVESLTPIRSLEERLEVWQHVSKKAISFVRLNVAKDYEALADFFQDFKPDTIIHFAEQRAAPYSMRSPWHKRYTVDNNINASNSVLCAMVEHCPEAHLIHLGTMGVYGYGGAGGLPIPEGYVSAVLHSQGVKVEREIMYPADPGSLYHTTKTLDALLFYFYNKNDGLKITDLHQGVVWGTKTPETDLDERLINRFDYDGDYGTVLNRFLVEAAVGHPLTVHGTGGQKRAFIHIRDSMRCIELAAKTPPLKGDRVRILNQMTEVHRVRDLAEMVAKHTGAEIAFYENPRNESPENELQVKNETLQNLGLNPTYLSEELLHEVIDVARRYASRINLNKIPATVKWRKP